MLPPHEGYQGHIGRFPKASCGEVQICSAGRHLEADLSTALPLQAGWSLGKKCHRNLNPKHTLLMSPTPPVPPFLLNSPGPLISETPRLSLALSLNMN